MLPSVPADAHNVQPTLSGKTILLTDDDKQLRQLVADLLDGDGYQVIVACDGLEALKTARAFDGIIHLLLSDIEMPGMTGIELASQLSRERPETKILLISGLPAGILVLNKGWSFLPKPFMADMLRNRVRQSLCEPIRVLSQARAPLSP